MMEIKFLNILPMEIDLQKLSLRPQKLINIVFVGHVDAGKSTICGRILVDLNLIDERTLEKYKQQSMETNRASWYLSWCMDLNPEEREKGKTTEVGTASFDLPHTRVNVLDTPGHKQFVGEMIDGASRADIGVLIISARTSEFEAGFNGGQTKEHILLLKSGNIEKLIVLVNKMDECEWSETRYREIETKIQKFTKKMFENIVFIPISGYHGDNIKTRRKTPYYDGPAFLEYLDQIEIKRIEGKPSMTVVERVKASGSSYFYAKIDSGEFSKGSECKILPIMREDKIASITNEDDVDVTKTVVGDTYKIKLRDYNEEISVGYKLSSLDNDSLSVANEFYAHIIVLEVNKALTIGYSAIFHLNLQSVSCKIVELISMEKKKIRVARKGERVVARIRVETPIVVYCKDEKKDRFSLRDESLTIASGIVKKIIN